MRGGGRAPAGKEEAAAAGSGRAATTGSGLGCGRRERRGGRKRKGAARVRLCGRSDG